MIKSNDKIKVVFTGGIEGETTGIVIDEKHGIIEFMCDTDWYDSLSQIYYTAGSIHLAHPEEVTYITVNE